MAKPRIFALLGLAIFLLVAPAPSNAAVAVSFSYFHDELAPHGRWVTVAQYGDVWCPSGIAAGWEPYTNGEWVYTDYGWTWVSDDPWGGDPFHYGTWEPVGSYGWCWIPGYVWSPAWVTWSYSDDFIGWAPIPPTLQLEAGGYFGPPVVVERTRYVFVPVNRFVGTRVATVRVPSQQNAVILGRARPVTRFQVASGVVRNEGPSTKVIERATHSPVRKTSISAARTRPVAMGAVPAGAKGRRISVVAPPQARVAEKARPAGKAAPARSAEKSRSAGAPAPKKAEPSGGQRHVASRSRVEHQPAAHTEARKAPKPASAESPASSHGKRPKPAEPVRPEGSARANHPPKHESAPPATASRPSAAREPVAAKAAPARPAPPREQVASGEASGKQPVHQPPPRRASNEKPKPAKEKPPGD